MLRVPTIRSKNFALLLISNFLLQLVYFLKIIKSTEIDVLVMEGLGPSNAALVAARIMKRRVVFDYSDFYPAFVGLYVSNSLVKRILQSVARLLTNFNVRFSDATVVVSDGLFDDGERYTGNIHKIINGVSEEYFPNSQEQHVANDGNAVISFVGAIEAWVSLESVIAAIVNLNRMGKTKLSLKIVGDGSKLSELREYISQNGLMGIVEFTGWVPYVRLHEYIESSNICVLPFDKSIISDLSMPMKVHEYAICKKPIIATPLHEIKELYGSSILYANNTEEYMIRIKLLLENQETRFRNIEEAYRIAKRHSWDTLGKEYEKILLNS